MNHRAYIMFGRFNPPTRGHEDMFRIALAQATKVQADTVLFVSSTQDKKNPLTYAEKVKYIKRSVPELKIGPKTVTNPAAALTWAQEQRYRDVTFIIGEDRFESFKRMIQSWQNAQDPQRTMEIRLAGTPRQMKVVSGTIARKLAQQGQLNQLKQVLISGAQDNTSATEIMRKIQNRLGVEEERDMRIKTFEDWLKEADPVPGDDTPKKKGEEAPEDKEPVEAPPDEEPTPEPPPPPLPITSTDDDGRVPSDTPENQSRLVIHPPTKLKTNMINKAKNIRTYGAKY